MRLEKYMNKETAVPDGHIVKNGYHIIFFKRLVEDIAGGFLGFGFWVGEVYSKYLLALGEKLERCCKSIL